MKDIIEVKDLSFFYPKNKVKAVNNISFNVKEGQIFGFLGPSGAGKSTTQKIITGILKNYIGSVNVFGKEVSKIGKDFYENIGVSFELPALYNKLTALENLQLAKSFYSKKTENPMKLLEMVGLSENADVKVKNFSKGMKMRLNFIRAFINNPDLLFLDEPTSGLDPVNSKMIKEIILKNKNERKTILLTTHNMNIADEICDTVAFIIDGEIKLIDSPKQLKIQNSKRVLRIEYFINNELIYSDFPLDKLGYNKEFLDLIINKNIKTIHSQESSLDEIFIQATGSVLE